MLSISLKHLQDSTPPVSYHLVAKTDSVEAKPERQLPDIPSLGSFTLEEILRYHLCVDNVLSKHEVRERSLSDSTTLLGILETTNKLLDMFNAAKATYSDRESTQSSIQRNLDRSGLVCLKNAISIGRHTLQKEDGDVIARTVIKSSVIQLGKNVADLKGWFYQSRDRSDLAGHAGRDSPELEELENVLISIWAFVAGMRE
ncbi:hypothetical protein GMOD_00001676 [Pyrenophora seminiperda CCB06]|uniref:Uncharacterized protein n=1 Tax=Pyrenophora seminiperda CCB06 TaxID=1302712 RepID=A0A3M7LZM4_9PLEO|nr:hypothetical protein GMOD_00001676 [Pyrenophora seminiperda CCB06]